MLLEWVEKGNPGETSLETSSVMTYELGDLVKMLFYSKVRPWGARAYMIEAKISLSDLLAQIIILCEREKWDFEEVKKLGIDRAIQRIERRLANIGTDL